MADGKELTQADIDNAVQAAVGKLQESIDRLTTKNEELIGENRKLKRGADIKPEDLQAAEDRADRAEAKVKELDGTLKTLTKERDTAVKNLETEQGAGRNYALDAEISKAIAAGGIVPALVPAFTAMVKQGAKAELVDGKYSVMIGDKPAADYIKGVLDSEDGKHFKAAPGNGGGGAPGGQGARPAAKTMPRADFEALAPADRMTFIRDGGQAVDAAA